VIVCHCFAVSDRTIRAVCESGARDVDDVSDMCGAGADCGGCRRRIERVVSEVSVVPVLIAS
jgi:bacterioferritin-associated ferredoxin